MVFKVTLFPCFSDLTLTVITQTSLHTQYITQTWNSSNQEGLFHLFIYFISIYPI